MHALLDFSEARLAPNQWPAALAALAAGDSIAGLASNVTCVLPAAASRGSITRPGWRWASPVDLNAVGDALARAGRADRHLLVMRSPLAAAADAIGALPDIFERDPLFGCAHPRFSVDPGGRLLPIFGRCASGGEISRDTLVETSPCYIVPEYLSPCFVLRRELVANVEPLIDGKSSVRELLADYLRRARRIGYRCVIINEASVALSPYLDEQQELGWAGVQIADEDTRLAQTRFARRAEADREQRLSALHTRPLTVLIDARNLGTTINGSSKALLGLTGALYRADTDWIVTLVASKEAAKSHDLDARYPHWSITQDLPPHACAVALRPTQPWDPSELEDLHTAAAVNIYLMLDTIAWDIVYTAPPRLDATWTFLAQYADALAFISDFSLQRFAARFPLHPDVLTSVCHLSLDPAEYVSREALADPNEPFWFVVGNHYDHKHLKPTLALLTRAFPTNRLAVLGAPSGASHFVALASGRADEHTVQSLYAGAELVIFPSLYEGFGLPIVNALAYGKTVVARDTALLREIADGYVGPGRLVPYSTPDELVHRLSHLRHGRPVPALPLGQSRSRPFGWRNAAETIIAQVERLVRPQAKRRERDRHATVTLLRNWKHEG